MRQPFRIQPQLPVQAFQTYQLYSPVATHYRTGTCEEAHCRAYHKGWQTTVNETAELGQKQAHYIRKQSGRKYTETNENGFTTFVFEAGQKCFAQHKVPLEREPHYIVKGGDWRGNPTGMRLKHTRADDWVDDFANHQDRIANQ